MERGVLKFSLMEKIANEEVRRRRLVADFVVEHKKRKVSFTGHVARFSNDRWTQQIAEWYPRGMKRPLGGPPRGWGDGFVAAVGKD